MLFKLTATITLLALCALGSADLLQHKHYANQRMSEYFLKSRALIEANPFGFFECFEEYNPQLDSCANDYKLAYGVCVASSESAQSGIDTEYATERSSLENDAKNTCSKFEECDTNNKDALGFFKCYSTAVS